MSVRVVALVVASLGWAVVPAQECPDSRLDLVFQNRSIGVAGHQSPELFLYAVDGVRIGVPPGGSAERTVYAAIVSQTASLGGVHGWSLVGALRGGGRVVAASVAGTAGAEVPDGLRNVGFEATTAVDSLFHEPESPGFASAVVLDFEEAVILSPVGTATVLAVTIASPPELMNVLETRLEWADGACCSSQPIVNAAVIQGETQQFCDKRPLSVRFVPQPSLAFRRGDANASGRVDLADAVTIFRYLYSSGRRPPCLAAADADDSATLELTDGILILLDFFRAGTGIAAPGPFACGLEPDANTLGCESYDLCP